MFLTEGVANANEGGISKHTHTPKPFTEVITGWKKRRMSPRLRSLTPV